MQSRRYTTTAASDAVPSNFRFSSEKSDVLVVDTVACVVGESKRDAPLSREGRMALTKRAQIHTYSALDGGRVELVAGATVLKFSFLGDDRFAFSTYFLLCPVPSGYLTP